MVERQDSPSRKPFTEEEDKEIFNIVNKTNMSIGGEQLWKHEASTNDVSF